MFRSLRVLRILVVAALFGISAGAAAFAIAPERNVERAMVLLDEGLSPAEGLRVAAELMPGEELPDGSSTAQLSVQVSDLAMSSDAASWLLTFVSPQVDGAPVVQHVALDWPTGAGGRGWVYSTELLLPTEFQDAAVVVEDASTGRWGGSWVEFAVEPARRPPGFVVLTERREEAAVTVPSAASPPQMPAARATASPPDESPVIRLIPPAGRPVVGRARFRTVVTTQEVDKAVFYLDGKEVAADERAPFAAVIELGKEPERHTIRVEAFGFRDLALGSDSLEINADTRPFSVVIRELSDGGEGTVLAAVDVSVPPGDSLRKLEFFRNEELVTSVSGPPFEAAIPAADGPGDFIRVLATLASGESLEDAQILQAGIISERVEVNLVEVYAVVTDREGHPVTDLDADSFRLKRGRRETPIERFALADEVPLVLGLIVDSSESMYPLMVETRAAAGQFYSSTLKTQDQGFLVDFDTQPRLAQGLTGELPVLLRGLRELRPGGNTAIYDAAIFSLAQFEDQPGRRALVLLTDGRDYGSRFSTRRCVQEARRLGAPIYIIVLNNLGYLPNAWRQDKEQKPPPVDASLETLVLQTGGRLFNLVGTTELSEVYATINAELRSQYLLTFSTDERLTEKELAAIKVDVDGKGLEVRTVTLNR